ncbi:MAG: hypothetical protein H0W67_10875 [Gemmatimonadales bacterium]|nr:hypothetical protein [Gemmatimonadales bacterium]
MSRVLVGLSFVLLTLAGCGGGDGGTGPDDPFPDVSGAYNVDGGFDGTTRSEAGLTGSLTLTQASRQSGTLGGTATLTLTVQGEVSTISDVAVTEASVTPAGVVSFRIGSSAQGATWVFSGTRVGATISGRHTLTTQDARVSGDWTATKP